MLDHVDALIVKVVLIRVKIGKGFFDLCQHDLFGLGAQVVKITALASLHFHFFSRPLRVLWVGRVGWSSPNSHFFSRPLRVLWVGRVGRSSPNSHTIQDSHQDRNVTALHFGSLVQQTFDFTWKFDACNTAGPRTLLAINHYRTVHVTISHVVDFAKFSLNILG